MKEKTFFYQVCKMITVPIFKIYFRLASFGVENIPATGGVIIASNHASYLDPVLLGCVIPRELRFIAREDLFRVPIFRQLIIKLHAYPLTRGWFSRSAIQTILNLLHQGMPVVVFPEGTRSYDGNLLPMQAGIGLIVYEAKVPVVPAYIEGSYVAWSRYSKFPKPKKISIYFGPAIELNYYYHQKPCKTLYKTISEVIGKAILNLKVNRIPLSRGLINSKK